MGEIMFLKAYFAKMESIKLKTEVNLPQRRSKHEISIRPQFFLPIDNIDAY